MWSYYIEVILHNRAQFKFSDYLRLLEFNPNYISCDFEVDEKGMMYNAHFNLDFKVTSDELNKLIPILENFSNVLNIVCQERAIYEKEMSEA